MSTPKEEYIFRKTSDGDYVRKAFGIEITGSKMSDMSDGFTHLIVSASVKINRGIASSSRAALEPKVRAAWTAMRYQVPGIACRSFKADNDFAFRYAVPSTAEDIEAWTKETVIFTDDVRQLREAYRSLKDEHWWASSADHYVAELHVSPSTDSWNLSLSLIHNFFDGRAAFSMVDVYLKYLTAEIEGTAKPAQAIEWGSETSRLQPPASFVVPLVETGSPPEIPSIPTAPPADQQVKTEEKPAVKLWLYPPTNAGGKGNISRDITFSREVTEKLHAIAKIYGYTMTQLFTAIFILAHTEAEFRTAGNEGSERFHELSKSFNDATHYLVAWTFINHRHKLPGGYNSFESQVGSPLLAQDGTSPVIPMDAIRPIFKLDESSNTVSRVTDESVFWSGLVAAVATMWKSIDQSLEAHKARDMQSHISSQTFDPAVFHMPALIISSIGDLGRLGILTNHLPNTSERPTLTVEDIVTGLRCTIAPIVELLYQYNGRLSYHFGTCAENTSEQSLQLETDLVQEWVDALIAGL